MKKWLSALLVFVVLLPKPAMANVLAEPDWLKEINLYRTAAGVGTVVEETAWSHGLELHFDYLALTPAEYFTGEYVNLHRENPASPYYTPEGDAAGRSSVLVSGAFGSPLNAIDIWLTAPFHAISMLEPRLTKVAFAQKWGWAGLNVSSGLDPNVPVPTGPILFAGPGMTTNLVAYAGAESPNPLETCPGWEPWQAGLPIIARLPQSPQANLTATLTGPGGTISGPGGDLCIVDEHTYVTTDPIYGPTGLSILQGSRAVLLIPRNTLTWGRYRVTISQPGLADVSWSFIGAPPWQVDAFRAFVLHVDSGGADTVMGNLTVTNPQNPGHTTVYPCEETRPNASNNNFVTGQTTPNFVIAHPDSNGDICLYTTGATDLIWDQVGETSAFATHNPARLLDTRVTGNRPSDGGFVKVHVASPGTATVLGNLTVTNPSGAGHTTAYPCDQPRPNASNNNYVTGETTPNFVIAHPDANGDLCFYASVSTELIWDQVGETSTFTTHNANRLLDTRVTGNRPGSGGIVQIRVAAPGTAAVMGNLTVTNPDSAGFTTAYPCDQPRPNSSNNNYVAGETTPNFVIAHPDANGDLCFFTQAGADLIWDQVGETNAFTTHSPTRIIDTREPHGFLG